MYVGVEVGGVEAKLRRECGERGVWSWKLGGAQGGGGSGRRDEMRASVWAFARPLVSGWKTKGCKWAWKSTMRERSSAVRVG